jgi:hypothetical protein
MSWARDGSGLLVKRIRGKTLPQWVTNVRIRQAPEHARWTRSQVGNGRLCNPDTMNRDQQNKRARIRERKEVRHGLGDAASARLVEAEPRRSPSRAPGHGRQDRAARVAQASRASLLFPPSRTIDHLPEDCTCNATAVHLEQGHEQRRRQAQ